MSAAFERKRKPPRELTGRAVLVCFLGFFGIVLAANALLVQVATSTFGGLETGSSYKAGLMFTREMAQAERQRALRWQSARPMRKRCRQPPIRAVAPWLKSWSPTLPPSVRTRRCVAWARCRSRRGWLWIMSIMPPLPASARLACWSRWKATRRRTSFARSASRSRCTLLRLSRLRFRPTRSTRRYWSVNAQSLPIADVVAKAAKDAGASIALTDYVRFQLGEGIEKEASDFAAEVAAAAGI